MIGQTVGKYRILDKIGRGGMGTVYRAMDDTLQREVAVKVLNAELNDPEVARRFRAEAITVARLSHPGIATIYELFEHESQWLMVMEFVRGETLENMVARMGQLSAQRAAELCMQALVALAHAHSMGVVHRDLKPANVMITENGTVKVMDFGIARVTGSEHMTNAGFMMGTPAYMAPEQVRGGEVDARADLYAMGVVFYRLTTGKLPFKGDTAFAMVQSQVHDEPTPISMLRADLPLWVGEVITKALQKVAEHRFQSAAEFHEGLARCLAGLPLSSMYVSGSGEILMTPARAMPSGAFQARPMPTPSAPMPAMTGSQPTMLSPGTNPGVITSGTDETMLTPAAGGALAMITPSGGTMIAPATKLPPAPPIAPPVQVRKSAKSNVGLIATGVGAVALVAIIAAIVYTGGQQEPAGETTSVSPVPTPEALPSPVTPPVETPVAQLPPPGPDPSPALTTSPVVPAASRATAPTATPGPPSRAVAKPSPGPTAPATRGTQPLPVPTPTPTPSPEAVAAPPETLATFPNVTIFTAVGRKVTDRDVTLNFVGGEVAVVPRNGGQVIATFPYKHILKATYVRGRDPRWDTTLPGPPADLDWTFMRQARHWLVVQGADRYVVIRLEDQNFRQILQTFEARTGIKIDRPASTDK